MSFAEWSNKKKKEREEKKPSQTIPSSTNVTTNNKELPSFEEWSNKKHEGARANTTNGQEGWQKYLDDQASSKQQESEERENESFWDKLGRWLGDTGATDTTLPMGNTSQIVHDVRNDTSYTKPSDDWSEEQQYEFGALYLESPEKAYAYAEKINKENAKAKEEAELNKIKDSATSNIGAGIAHTAGAIASSGLALADYLKMLVDSAAGRDPMESDGIVSPFEYSQAVQEGIATDLNERYGTLDESIPVIGGKGWGDAYGLGTSIAQSAISGYTLGPAGTLVSYFGQGAASGMQDALERGADDWQAAIYGASLGAFEGIAEQIGIDNLFKMGSASTLKGLLKNIVKQAGAEGLEEGLTTFLSTMADDFIMQDKSQFNQLAAQYMALGLSEEEAKKQAAKDIWEGLAFDALAGAISGGVHGGVQTGVQTGISNHYAEKYFGNQSQDLVNDAINSPNSNVQEIGQKYQEMLNSGKTLSGWNLNELLEVTDTDKIQNAIRQRLASLGETGDVSELAEIISKEQSGEDLSRSERAILENSRFGKDVYYEIERRKLNTIDDSNKWMENVGTRRTSPELYNKTEYSKKAAEVLPGTTQPTASKESKYKSSESGKTTLKGEEVSIQGVESIKNGEITVRLKDGKSVKASDLDFGSHTEALMYDIVGRMDATAKTANMILRTVKPSNEALARMYYNSLPLAYEYGKIGYEAGLKNVKLPLNVKNNIYTRGRIDAMIQARVNTPQTNSTQNVSNKTDSGIIYENDFTYDEASANEMQRVSMAHIEVINKMTNLEVHVFESKVENGKRVAYINGDFVSAPNGYFKDGNKIYIDFNAGNNGEGAMLYTMSHEITHYIREWNAKGFKELGDFLIEQYGKKKVNVEYLLEKQRQKIQKRYQSEGKALPSEAKLNDMAYEEMVADAMSDMLTDPKAYEKLAKLKSQNITLWEKVGEAIKAVLDKLKTALGVYKERDVAVAKEANHVRDFSSNAYEKLQDLYIKAFVEADANYGSSIGSRDLKGFAEAKNENGEPLFQYRAMEADEATYREMLYKWGGMTSKQIDNLFTTVDNAMEVIKDNLEVLDYAWEADIDDRAFSPVKPNSDKLYQVSLDFSTLCRKRILQQTVAAQLQEALNKPLTREEGIAIRDALIALQEEGRQIEVACALCYVESARMKSPEQIKRFMENKEKVIKEFFAGKSGGNIKDKIKQAEVDVREKLHKENPNGITGKDGTTKLDPRTASLKALPKKYADAIRDGKKAAKESYKPTADEQKLIDIAKSMTVSDFTSPEGLENLAKNYPGLFDAYTSYIRNATKSKGIEGDTWWRAGDSAKIGDVLIANMNKENGLRTQSWSDFQVIHILDYIASTIELATRNTKEQAYTKVPDYVELMGSTGVMINMSLIPTANFNGTLDYDSVEGIDYKRALALRDKYHATAGTICIGVDNAQIQLLLADKTIDYVIPYHKSGMSKALRKLMHLPTWSDYESYQSESNLSRSDAEKQAKKYGVKLLDASDPNYHKGTTFSEWFDKKEAQQIAKIENANPSDKAKQKKYGVMYGGYMAMQNAANNYLKLCAERGISPKFSHEKADFTVEENYWKLLIDRKMIDNVTGEIIEQQTIKPIFNQGEVMRILNDEVARYPKVKEDQDYAIRTVTEKMLSGEVKGGMSAEAIAKVMKKPVDNVTNVNILASSEGMKFSDRDSEGNELSTEQIEFFKDSKVRDAEGRLVSLYHGTPNGGFTEFKLPHYLHSLTSANGAGFYFTDERNARQYMKGLNGKSVTKKKLYNVYLNITNPLEITEYSTGAISDEVFRRIMARGNYEWGMAHTDVEKLLQFNKLDTDRLAEMVKVFNGDEILTVMKEELGYDGVRYTDRYGDVWVAWDNRQIKETTNKTPTSHPDIRYSDRDSEYLDAVNRGDMETAQKMVDEAAKEAGYDVTTYHGTDRDFTTFNTLYYNEFGYHTGTKRAAEEIAEYKLDGKIMKLYTKLGNTIRTPDHFGKITAMHDYIYIVRGEDHKTVDREELEGKTSTFKNKFPNNEQLEKLHKMCVDWINDRDSQYTTQDIMQATQDYFKSIGVDTIEYTNDVEDKGSTSYLLMNANQVKSADPVTYDGNGKVIPLSERFKADNDDIRYSDREIQSVTEEEYASLKKHFGVTTNFKVAGYLLPDGKLLDFSGKHWGDTTSRSRQVDHRDAEEVLDRGNNGYASMVDMIGSGSIRLMPETGGINLAVYPNEKQRRVLSVYIKQMLATEGQVIIDYDAVGGDTVYSRVYEKYASSEQILRDIRNYFNGARQSDLMQFHTMYSDRVTDEETLEFLENQEHVTVYRAMQVIDGKLYPPMNAYTKDETGKKVLMPPSEIGEWEQAVERPDLIDPKTGKFKLDKGKVDDGKRGTIIPAAYNPYIHTSASPLNDQFSSAYKRSNLVVVEGEIPSSELTSGYRAEFAKDTVGETKWHSGPVAGQLKGDKARRVFLSRWFKPVRIVPDSEVASIVAKTLEGENIDVPYNVVTPSLRTELEKVGVSIKYSDRDNEATSNRTILANALESVAQNDLEKTKLNQYKRKIALIDSEQARLNKIKASLRKLYFTSGKRDVDKIKSLQESATMIENRINTYDRQLLRLEATEALKAVLQREKQMAYNKAKKEGQEALRRQKEKNAATVRELMNRNTESRQKATESRNKTAVREKIKRVVSDLNKLLLNPTQDKHVPIGLQKVVAEALDTINMDTMNAGERASYYNDLISKSKNPDEVAMLTKKRDFFAYRDANFKDRITELKNAYAEFKESDDPLIRNAHNDAIADLISNTADEVGNKSLKDMSLSQLERVYDMYKAILATVRNANRMFKEGKQETVTENSDAVKLEVRSVGGHKDRVLKITKFLKKFGWNMLKPITAMKVIGSKTFERLFNNVRAAEDTWAVDVNEAKRFFEDMAEKYGYKKWDLKKYYSFKDSAGTNISLSLEQIMSLYAYSKREQADKHLEFGGFIFDDSIEVIEKKLGIPLKYEVNDANPYRLRKEHLLDITNSLTKEQKDFVDAMQTYLSDVMGAKGNEVSLAMYDIKLYKEKNYFPLKTSRYFREFDPEKSATPKIKNSGFSKKTTPQAGNPIVLSNFMDVWAGHVNDMSMYHAFVLPLEDFMRVYNYSSTIGGYDSVQQYIKNAYGSQANQYIERLMDDLNGGARTDSSADAINKGLSLFKKASVFASASVVVQQPSAIARALAYINPKYFAKATPGALNIARHKALWAEVKKYAPVAVIKEMGYFDTGVGRSTVDWIKGNQTFKDKMDDVLSKAPALADELCWVHIWEAVKRENAAKSKSKYGSEMFLMECGKRFTEVVTNTQVYDSVLSRSGMMRSKDTGMKMATAFMAEPTTAVNMMVDGFIQGMRGNKKFTAATVGAVSASVILNSILVSLVYAARDDDEDETYLEKYIGSLVSELLDGFNPLTYIPFVKDIWSILQGYDVERSDMSVISKLWESIESLFNENKSGWEKTLEMTGSIASLFGIPLKNIIRDAEGMYNLTDTILSGIPTTEAGIQYAIEDAFKSSIPLWDRLHESDSKTDKLYDAIMSGDQNQINRVMATYKSEQAYETALKSALRENDSRINEAAQARLDGNILEYARIAKQIIAEGRFSQDTVVAAINAEMSAIKKAQSDPAESTDDNDEVTSIYKADDINAAFNNGDKALAISIIDELVKMKVANGMEEKKAKSSLRSSMTSYWKPLYIEAAKSGNKAEMQRIKQIMYYSGLYGSAADVVKAVKGWTK